MMKLKTILITAFLLTMMLGGYAHALTFSVQDVHFTDVIGNSQDIFNWRVVARNDRNYDLNVGDRRTFTYGYFRVNDFPISFAEANDTDDSFTANFSVMPPAQDFMLTGSPFAVQTSSTNNDPTGDYVYLQFPNSSWQQYAFGNGGLFSLRFLDPRNTVTGDSYLYDKFSTSGEQLRLRAQLRYDVAPVPEPGTFALVGFGLVGLLVTRKKFFRS